MSIGECIFIGAFIFVVSVFIGATLMEYILKRRYEEEIRSYSEQIQSCRNTMDSLNTDVIKVEKLNRVNNTKIKMLKLQIYELIRDKKER